MKLIAKGKFLILKLIEKEEYEKKGSLILSVSSQTETPRYRVYHSGNSKTISTNDIVVLNGYAQPLDLDGEVFFVVAEEGIAAVIE